MVGNEIKTVEVVVADKIREYYKEDKKLGGVITIHTVEHIDVLWREINIRVPFLDRQDKILINGVEYAPKEMI